MRRRILFAFIAFLVLAAFGTIALDKVRGPATKQIAQNITTCPHDKELSTYSQWRQSVSFPYRDEAKLKRITNNYKLVEVGSSKADVLRAFGAPDYEEEAYPKEFNGPCIGYVFKYQFEIREETNTGEMIEVFFKPYGRVNWIVGNVGLPEKGGYTHRP